MRFDLIAIPVSLKRHPINLNKTVSDTVRAVKHTASGEALQMLRLFHKTTATWNHQPKFNFKVADTSEGIEVTIWTDDDVYRWLDIGTERRFMHMTRDFEPKTSVGFIGSVRGKGGKSHLGAPLPGIEARKFTTTIYSTRSPIATRHIQERFNKEIAKLFIR